MLPGRTAGFLAGSASEKYSYQSRLRELGKGRLESRFRNLAASHQLHLFSSRFHINVVSLLTIDEIREAQFTDSLCAKLRHDIDMGKAAPFSEDKRGLIVRIAPIDKAIQIVLPSALRSRALHLANHTPVAGHPSISRQYYTMRRTFFWPSMAADIAGVSKTCHACAKERTKLRLHQAPLKLFPATGPLEFVAIDILGPLPRSSKGHLHLLVITDRFSKLTRVVPLATITALSVANAFINHWVFAYGAPARLLSDNGSQFTAKFFQAICTKLGIKNVFTTAYHPQTNGQTESFNRKILSGLRAFVADHPATWHEDAGSIAYAYNIQVHNTTRLPPFDLVLTRPPPPTSLKRDSNPAGTSEPKLLKQRFMKRIAQLTNVAAAKTKAAQQWYKRNYDAHIKLLAAPVFGDFVYVERQRPSEDASDGERRRHKLQAKAEGPYEVTSATSHTVTIDRDGLLDTITRSRISKAPNSSEYSPAEASNNTIHEPASSTAPTHDANVRILTRKSASRRRLLAPTSDVPEQNRAIRTNRAPAEPLEHVVDHLVEYNPSADVFRVRWHGFDSADDT